MFVHYEPKQRTTQMKNKLAKAQFFRSSLKSRQDLSFLKAREDHQCQLTQGKSFHRTQFHKFVPHTLKHEDRANCSLKDELLQRNRIDVNHSQFQSLNDKKISINIPHNLTHLYSIQHKQRKHQTQNIKPEFINNHQAAEYQKLHDKLNYLESKITEMKSNLERKRDEKKKYFEKQIRQREKMKQKQCAYVNDQKQKQSKSNNNNPLKQVVCQVACNKNLKPVSFDPYSPRHNIYYVSQIVRAYKQEISLARQHLISSIQFLKMLGRNRIPNKQEITGKDSKFPKKPIHQDKKTVIFDLDETLIHCNENLNTPSDIKLPIKFPTGQIIYAGINIRPYAVELLRELSKSFEIIVFTASHSCYANVVLNHLDPENKYISHRLFREHCYYVDRMHVKDLRVLNRDLSQTVIIDNAAYSFAFQIDNGIPIIPYYEGKIDFELKALQAYLESMIFCKDVRELNRTTFSLYRYNEFDNPESLVKELYATSL